jgi:hypothetical protein
MAVSKVRPVGFVAPARFAESASAANPGHGNSAQANLAQLASQVLQDPLAMRWVGDRVVELLRRDLRQQQERSRGYGRRG